MSNNLIHMEKVRLILKLYTEGVSKKSISEKSGCTRNTVKKYIRQFISMGMPYEELIVNRQSVVVQNLCIFLSGIIFNSIN